MNDSPPCCFPDCDQWSVKLIGTDFWQPNDPTQEPDNVYVAACADHVEEVQKMWDNHDPHRFAFAWEAK